jgi:cobalt transporter subunit CbtB
MSASANSKVQSSAKSGVVLQSAFAVMLGIFTVGMVGFSHIDVVHNAAHDARHSNAFPCH